MHGIIKNHKENNPAWLITRGCGTAVEFLSFFGENYLYEEVIKKIDFRIKGTPYMLKVVIWSISGANPQNFEKEFFLLKTFSYVSSAIT